MGVIFGGRQIVIPAGPVVVRIIRQGAVYDGYDVLVALDSGEHMTVHFATRPADVAAAVAAFVAALPEPVVYEIEGE